MKSVKINKEALLQARRCAQAVTGRRVSDEDLIKTSLNLLTECLVQMGQALPQKEHSINLEILGNALGGIHIRTLSDLRVKYRSLR